MTQHMKIPDLTNFANNFDLIILFFGILTVDVVVIFLTRYYPHFFGTALNMWYTNFNLLAVLSDVLIILIGFQIARWIWTKYMRQMFGTNTLYFVALVVLVQMIHDILFYIGVIKPIRPGHNAMMDVFKHYSQGGAKIIAADSLLMIFSFIVSAIYKAIPLEWSASASIMVTYAMTYILYTKPQL